MAEESATRCCTSATRDVKTSQGRYEHEGLSFFTITLPAFGKDFQKSLDQGLVGHDMFSGFARHAGLPRFLGGFLDLVFNRASGVLLDRPSIDAILAIRQLTLMFSKVLLPCNISRERAAIDQYVECEQEVKRDFANLDSSDLDDFRRIASLLFSEVFTEVDRKIYNGELIPRHGPGATADKLRGNSKFRQREWPTRLEEVFHASDFLFSSVSHYVEHYDEIRFLEPGQERPVKVISVPKTQKSPRLIAKEPTCMQYMQQAVSIALTESISRSYLDNFIGFEHQEPNQLYAQKGSSDGTLATLDLSEASDRISNQLVRAMLSSHPHLQRAVEATRSRRADVPGYGKIRLAKFASMGSALTFPIEACVFLTLCLLGIERSHSTRYTRRADVLRLLGSVRIYGDDIIIPVDHVHSVIHTLEHFGARVGMDKSFWIGRFRESCGKEYYDGHDVSLVKVRRDLPTSRKDAQEVVSAVSLRNQLYKAGYWQTARIIDSLLERILKWYPVVEESSPVLGRVSFLGYQSERECPVLHRPLVKGYVVSARSPISRLDGSDALLKCFLKRGIQPNADVKHLERSGRPRAVNIKPRWTTPY